MKIRILTVGKLDNKHYKALSELYLKRISHYLSVSSDHIKAERIASLSASEIKSRESKKLLQRLPRDEYVIALDRTGKQLASEEFAQMFDELSFRGRKKITFVIGGPIGLDDEILRRADLVLSLSEMTFAHELVSVILLEQIYRALTILRGEQYHK